MRRARRRAVCDLVAKCTAKKAADRPQGFGPVCAELEQMIATPDAATAADAGAPPAIPSAASRPLTHRATLRQFTVHALRAEPPQAIAPAPLSVAAVGWFRP
jgi:hypothetical protein